MKTESFTFELPPELIAQKPVEPRDMSKLMVVERSNGRIKHFLFRDLPDFLNEGDCLVINTTRVFPGRLSAKKETGGNVEILLLERLEREWKALTRGAKVRPGTTLFLKHGLRAVILDRFSCGEVRLRFEHDSLDPESVAFEQGSIPLPPYIKSYKGDVERYQTIYSEREISAAAPTAGLHFTDELLSTIQSRGISIAPCELAVGLDTFRPIREDEIEGHKMHSEWYSLGYESAELINSAKQSKRRVISCGTTCVRVLETLALDDGRVAHGSGRTDLFIKPGYHFRVADALITNFHLPRSTLLVLVCAFGGMDLILGAYRIAVKMRYRFYSFGDAMLIL